MTPHDHPTDETHCPRHGKPLIVEYEIVTAYCEDCEPGDADGEDFRGNEAAGYQAEQQAAAWGLK